MAQGEYIEVSLLDDLFLILLHGDMDPRRTKLVANGLLGLA